MTVSFRKKKVLSQQSRPDLMTSEQMDPNQTRYGSQNLNFVSQKNYTHRSKSAYFLINPLNLT